MQRIEDKHMLRRGVNMAQSAKHEAEVGFNPSMGSTR